MADEETRNRSSASVSPEGGRLIGRVKHVLKRLHGAGTERDRAGNRRLFFDDYLVLLLFSFFNPSIKSLRALQQSTNWESTRQKLGSTTNPVREVQILDSPTNRTTRKQEGSAGPCSVTLDVDNDRTAWSQQAS